MTDERIRQVLKLSHEGERPPPLGPLLVATQRRPRRLPWALALAGSLTAVALGLVWVGAQPRTQVPVPLQLATSDWTAPTDFLLETPGIALLRDMPRLSMHVPDYTKGAFP